MKFELAWSEQISFSVRISTNLERSKEETNKQKNAHHNPYMIFFLLILNLEATQ